MPSNLPLSDWIKTRDYTSWATLYDHIPSEALRHPFHVLKRSIYQEPSSSTSAFASINQPETHISDIGSPLTDYESEEDQLEVPLDFPPALSTGPNWNRNLPLPESMLQVINTSFDPDEPCNVKVVFNREDALTRFHITEKHRALAADAEVPSNFKELEIKV